MNSQKPKSEKQEFASMSISQFLESKLNGYLDRMIKLERADLHSSIMGEVESCLINIVLKKCDYNQMKTSKILGINRSTLSTKIKQYNIKVEK